MAALVGALLVAATVAGAGVVLADTGTERPADSTEASSITVTGSGTAEATPDEARLRIAVQATAEDASTARDAVAENVSAVREALVALGIDEDQIRTVDYDLYEDERRAERRAQRRQSGDVTTVYRGTHDLAVEIGDTDRLGAAIDAAVDAGATVQDAGYTLTDATRDRLRTEALENAMADARSEADTVAASANLSVTGMQTAETRQRPYVRRTVELAAAGGGDGGTDIAAGPVSVSASVEATYNATA